MILRLTLTMCFFVNLALHAQNEEKEYELERVTRQKNHIQQVLTYEFGATTKDSSLIARDFYDTTGNLTQRQQYDKTATLQYKGIITYNDKGLEMQETGYDGAGNLIQLFVYSYDKNGHRTDYRQLNAQKKILTYQKSVFNAKGQRSKLYNYREDQGRFYLSGTFAYDSVGHLVGATSYNAGGIAGDSTEYVYNGKDNLVIAFQLADKQKVPLYVNRYDYRNLLTETQFYRKAQYVMDGRTESVATDRKRVFRYDADSNRTEESTWINANLVSRIRYYFIRKTP